METLNANPIVYSAAASTTKVDMSDGRHHHHNEAHPHPQSSHASILAQSYGGASHETDEDAIEPVDEEEIFDVVRNINDPEHPLTLEQLNVAQASLIKIDSPNNRIDIRFTPTIPHCSMATLIGLCLRVKLLRSLPSRFKVDIHITPGTHASEDAINKQLNDKERVAAALENSHLLDVVTKCIANSDPPLELEKLI